MVRAWAFTDASRQGKHTRLRVKQTQPTSRWPWVVGKGKRTLCAGLMKTWKSPAENNDISMIETLSSNSRSIADAMSLLSVLNLPKPVQKYWRTSSNLFVQ